MLSDADLVRVLAFSQNVEKLRRQLGEMSRSFNALHTDAVGINLLLTGPAQDAAAKISDSQTHLADSEGLLRELEIAVTGLLNAQSLRGAVADLGWTFDGWTPDIGWTARRQWEPGGRADVVADRNTAALLHKLRLRNAEEGSHAG